jgi:hypothetical protein
MSRRLNRGEGKDMGGKDISSRRGGEPSPDRRITGMNTDMLSPAARVMAAEGLGKGQIAHKGTHGAPTIYREKPGGRRFMRGGRG